MTRFKWINRWISADMTGFHLFVSASAAALYGCGWLIPDSRLMRAGYVCFFLTALFFLLHLQLHACDHFLSMHPATDQIPKSQMKLVNGVYMAVFLAAAGGFMAALSLLRLDWLWARLKEVLAAILRALAALLPDVVPETAAPAPAEPLVPPFLGEGAQSGSLLARIFDVLLSAVTAAVFLLLAASLLRQLFLFLVRLLKAREDGDEKEFLKPAAAAETIFRRKRKGKPLWRDFTIEGRIRRAYKKEIEARLKETCRLTRAETPKELERLTGFHKEAEICRTYHWIYEKARYGNGSSREELEILNDLKHTIRKTRKTTEEQEL